MEFEIVRSNKNEETEEYYLIKDKSFDCDPLVNVDINIAMAYLYLGVDSEDMCVKCLWGFSPRECWKEARLVIPPAEEGKLKLIGEYTAGLTWRIDGEKLWESFYDNESGWYCIGKPTLKRSDRTVKLMKNMIVVLDVSKNIKSVWVKPKFV